MYRIVYVHHIVEFGDVDIHIGHDSLVKSLLCGLLEHHNNRGYLPLLDGDFISGLIGTCIDQIQGYDLLSDELCNQLYVQLHLYAINFITYIESLMDNNKTQHVLYHATTYSRIIVLA